MLVKVAELIGPALDWAVAKVEKHQPRYEWMLEKEGFHAWQSYERAWGTPIPLYSSDWAQGGLIIDNNPRIVPTYDERFDSWFAYKQSPALYGKQSFLVSAMRAYVASKLGDTVDIPDELFKGNKC